MLRQSIAPARWGAALGEAPYIGEPMSDSPFIGAALIKDQVKRLPDAPGVDLLSGED